jgi:hypothetical protein
MPHGSIDGSRSRPLCQLAVMRCSQEHPQVQNSGSTYNGSGSAPPKNQISQILDASRSIHRLFGTLRLFLQSQPRPPSSRPSSAGSTRSPQASEESDPWAEIAVAPPRPSTSAVSSSKPARTSATAASRPVSARPPAAQSAQHVSLESMLGNSMLGGGPKPGVQQAKHVSLDSIKKGAPMKLGAQRLNR